MSQLWTPPAAGDQLANARQQWNDADESLRTRFSGAAEPAAKVAYQSWADTSEGWLKERNAANTAWNYVRPLGQAGIVAMRTWVQFTDLAVPVSIATLPANHVVLRAGVITTVAFDDDNTSGALMMNLGYSTNSAAYIASAIVDAVGYDAGAGSEINIYASVSRAIEALFSYGGTGSVISGKALVWLEAMAVPVQP